MPPTSLVKGGHAPDLPVGGGHAPDLPVEGGHAPDFSAPGRRRTHGPPPRLAM